MRHRAVADTFDDVPNHAAPDRGTDSLMNPAHAEIHRFRQFLDSCHDGRSRSRSPQRLPTPCRGLLRVAEKSNDPRWRWLFSITVHFENNFNIQMVNE